MASKRIYKGYTITVTPAVASNQWHYEAVPDDPARPTLASDLPYSQSRAAHSAAQAAVGQVVGFTKHSTPGAGRPKKASKKVSLTITIDSPVMLLLSNYAESVGLSTNMAAAQLLTEALKNEGANLPAIDW